MKTKEKYHKETVVSARRLLQYFQTPDKYSLDISRYIYNFFPAVQNSYVFIPLFLSEPLTVFCGTLTFRGTLSEKHWHTCVKVSMNHQTS